MASIRAIAALIAVMACVAVGGTRTVSGSLITLGGADYAGSGATLPDNALSILLQDISGGVRVTIDGTNLPSNTGKVSDVVLNVDPTFSGPMTFAHVSGVAASSTSFSPNGQNGWGEAGSFDVRLSFSTSGTLGSFYPGKTSVYDLTGTGLNVNSFMFGSTGAESKIAAFHLNITGNGQSGKYGDTDGVVPEPMSVALWGGLALFGAAFTLPRRVRHWQLQK